MTLDQPDPGGHSRLQYEEQPMGVLLPFLILSGTVFCIFFLFSALATSLHLFFPSKLIDQISPDLRPPFFLHTALKSLVLVLMSVGIFIFLIRQSRRYSCGIFSDGRPPGIHAHVFSAPGLCYVIVSAMFLGYLVFTTLQGHDEGIYAHVARNLAVYGRYALGHPGFFRDFSPWISVGPTVLVPLAGIYKYIGDGLFLTRLYALLWLVPALGMLYAVYARLLKGYRLWVALALSFLFFHTPELRSAVALVMGEIPALFFLLAACFMLPGLRTGERIFLRLFFSGVLFGLAMVTKLTLVIFISVFPMGLILLYFYQRPSRPYLIKGFGAVLLGMLIPLAPWYSIELALSKKSMSYEAVYIHADHLIFGVKSAARAVMYYGGDNFLKLILLWGAASAYLAQRLRKGQGDPKELFLYLLAAFLLLWFFFFTYGHRVRYTLYAIFFLIPLAVKFLPESIDGLKGRPVFVFLLLAFLLFFPREYGEIQQSLSRRNVKKAPELPEQLKAVSPQLPAQSVVWTVDKIDDLYLSVLTDPPVYRLQGDLLADGESIPYAIEGLGLERLRKNDWLGVGIRVNESPDYKLFILTVHVVPASSPQGIRIEGQVPPELCLKLVRRLPDIGLSCNEHDTAGAEEKNYVILRPLFPDKNIPESSQESGDRG